jgi:mRNA-degrading endonuclease RelE of RelBE toxin-antitoxin system
MLKINFSKQAEKIIEKLINKEPQLVKLICQKIEELALDPKPINSKKKLINRPEYRVRVRNYRIIYEYDNKYLYVIIINKRDKVYN